MAELFQEGQHRALGIEVVVAEQGDRPGQLAAVELVSGQAGGGRAVGGIVEEGLAQGGLGTERVALVIGKLGDQQPHRGGVAGGAGEHGIG